MSIVTDILLTSGSLDKMNTIEKLNDHVKHIEEIKHGLLESLEKYYSLCQNIEKFKSYKSKFFRYLNNIKKFNEEINFYLKSENNIDNNILREKKYLDETITLIELIIKIQSLIENTNSNFEQKEYIKISESTHFIQKTMLESMQPDLKELKNLFIAKNSRIQEKLLCELNEIFNANYKWEFKDDYCKLTILDLQSISSVLFSLENCESLDKYAYEFSENILKFIFEPIFCKETKIFLENNFLKLEYIEKRDLPEIYILKEALKFFEIHIQTENEKLFFHKVGKYLTEKLVNILIEKLYKPVIIKSRNDFEKALKEFSEIQGLEKFCKDIKFIIDNNKKLDYYNKNIKELCIEERCKNILLKSQHLIKNQITKFVHSSDLEFECKKIKLSDELELESCLNSEMMRDLISNCYQLLNESKIESGFYVKKYFQYIKHIIKLYLFAAPKKHEKLIQSLPLVAALFYNDCMLLGYHIMLMQLMINEPSSDVQLSLRDLVMDVKRVGMECILKFIALTKMEIIKCIDLDGFQSVDVFCKISLSFEHVFLQLQDLKKVWIQTLPPKMTHKFIGLLLNATMLKVSAFIMSLEHISQADSIKLVAIINNLLSMAEQLLDSTTITVFAPRAGRLAEIKFVLGANLIEIDDRWLKGKGPLAREFNLMELESLLSSLFRNNNDVVHLLNSIK